MINLKNILDSHLIHTRVLDKEHNFDETEVLYAMKEACRQTLELAAKNIKIDALVGYGTDIPDCWDEDSITNTIKQVE